MWRDCDVAWCVVHAVACLGVIWVAVLWIVVLCNHAVAWLDHGVLWSALSYYGMYCRDSSSVV